MDLRRLSADDLVVRRPLYVDAIGLFPLLDQLEGKPTILYGPKGTGKTIGLEAWAADHDYRVVQFGCTEGTRERHLYGSLGLEGDSVFFTLGALTTAIEVANELLEQGSDTGVMLRLDEINCFAHGAPVSLPYGSAVIERLNVGDAVLSTDPLTRRTAVGEVQQVHTGWVDKTYVIRTEEGIIRGVTGRHGYWTKGGWKRVSDLTIGDFLGVPVPGLREGAIIVQGSGGACANGPWGEPNEEPSRGCSSHRGPGTTTEDLGSEAPALAGSSVPREDGCTAILLDEQSDARPGDTGADGGGGLEGVEEELEGPGMSRTTSSMVAVSGRTCTRNSRWSSGCRDAEDSRTSREAQPDLEKSVERPCPSSAHCAEEKNFPRRESGSEGGIHPRSQSWNGEIPDCPREEGHRTGRGVGAAIPLRGRRDILALDPERGTPESGFHHHVGSGGANANGRSGGRRVLAPFRAGSRGERALRERELVNTSHYGHRSENAGKSAGTSPEFRWIRVLGIWEKHDRVPIRDLTVLPFHTYHAYGHLVHNSLTPQMQKGLNSFTDWQRSVSVPSIKHIFRLRPEAKLWIVGTMNPAGHGGVYDLNEDLQSRFRQVFMDYPKAEQERFIVRSVLPDASEELVDVLITLAVETRQGMLAYQLSTRDIVQAIEDATNGLGTDKALKLLSYRYETGQDRDTFHARVKASTRIDLTTIELFTPPSSLSLPLNAGVGRRARQSGL